MRGAHRWSIDAIAAVEGSLTGQETFEFAYVLAGLALASAPILYLLFPRSGLVLIGCVLAAAATFILDGAIFLAGSLVLAAIMAAVTPKDRVANVLLFARRHRRRGHPAVLEIRRCAQIDDRDALARRLLRRGGRSLARRAAAGRRSGGKTAILAILIALFVVQHNFNLSSLNDLYSQDPPPLGATWAERDGAVGRADPLRRPRAIRLRSDAADRLRLRKQLLGRHVLDPTARQHPLYAHHRRRGERRRAQGATTPGPTPSS